MKIKSRKFLYGSALAKTKETLLLKRHEMENLAGASDFDDFCGILEGTFLGKYLKNRENPDAVYKALESALVETKKDIISALPDPSVLQPFWAYYDFINRHYILNAHKLGADDQEIEKNCSALGNISPRELIKRIKEENAEDRIKITFESYVSENLPKVDPFMGGFLKLRLKPDVKPEYAKKYEETENEVLLEFSADSALLQYARQNALSLFTGAPSVHYFLSIKLAAETVSALLYGFTNRIPSQDMLYHLNEKYGYES